MKNLLGNQAFYLIIIIILSCTLFLLFAYYFLVDAPKVTHSQKLAAVPIVPAITPAIDTAILNNMDSNRLNELRKQLKVGMEAKVNNAKVGAEISGRESK